MTDWNSLIQQLTAGGQRPQIGMPGAMQGYQSPWAQMSPQQYQGAFQGLQQMQQPAPFQMPQLPNLIALQNLPQLAPPGGGRPQMPMGAFPGKPMSPVMAPRPAMPQGRPMQPLQRVSPGVYRNSSGGLVRR